LEEPIFIGCKLVVQLVLLAVDVGLDLVLNFEGLLELHVILHDLVFDLFELLDVFPEIKISLAEHAVEDIIYTVHREVLDIDLSARQRELAEERATLRDTLLRVEVALHGQMEGLLQQTYEVGDAGTPAQKLYLCRAGELLG